MPVCPNWWHNDIGVPKKMAIVLLMLRDKLSEEELQGELKVLERSRFGMTGQNKVWLAGNNLMKGLLIDDPELVQKARDYIAEEIYITEEEGIQPDWSFHQHGPQIQSGNYGLAFADGALILMQDGKEFDNIFACWDWRKVPGVTAYNDGKQIKCDDIEPSFRDRFDTCEVFKIRLEHPTAARADSDAADAAASVTKVSEPSSYEYLLLPDKSWSKTKATARKVRKGSKKAMIKVLRNGKERQAVRHGDVICVIFHEPGNYTFAGKTFSSDTPAIVISDSSGLHTTPLEQVRI